MATFISIGGGEIKNKTTLAIDRYIVQRARAAITDGHRPYALFFPTASYDSNPYFNSFRKTYTSEFDVKSDVALLTKGCMSVEHIAEKIAKADIIYVGGGNTLHLIDVWRKAGIDELVWQKYLDGTVLCGLSAGAICWFENMYTDSVTEGEYHMHKGLARLCGTITPHFNHRPEFESVMINSGITSAYAVEDNAAIVFENGTPAGSISSVSGGEAGVCPAPAGGNAYLLTVEGGKVIKKVIPEVEK